MAPCPANIYLGAVFKVVSCSLSVYLVLLAVMSPIVLISESSRTEEGKVSAQVWPFFPGKEMFC